MMDILQMIDIYKCIFIDWFRIYDRAVPSGGWRRWAVRGAGGGEGAGGGLWGARRLRRLQHHARPPRWPGPSLWSGNHNIIH